MNNIVDVHTLANFWNVDVRTVQNYADDSKYNPPLPRAARGQYDFLRAMKWMYEMQKEKIYKLETSGDETLANIKKEKELRIIRRIDLEYRREINKLVDKKSVLIAFTNIMNIINTNDTYHKYDLKRDLEGILDESKKNEIIEKSFETKKQQLSKMEIEKHIFNEELITEIA